MEFWNSLLTEKSWRILQQLKQEKWRFIVIGGWAAYLWTRQHKSRDIDVILPYLRDLEVLRQRYDLRKNDRLKKYEVKFEEIDLDIYVPYYSTIALPIEDIATETARVEGFEVVLPEILLILKQGAEENRKESIKGQKDRIDIMTLLCHAKIDFNKYRALLEKYRLTRYRQRLKEIVQTFRDLRHIAINEKDYAQIKRQLLGRI